MFTDFEIYSISMDETGLHTSMNRQKHWITLLRMTVGLKLVAYYDKIIIEFNTSNGK